MNSQPRDIFPSYSKTRVNRAGNHIRDDTSTSEDIEILENWRASHIHVLNTFQANLRNRSQGTNTIVAQRLKRKPTIIDKLNREPKMQLARMHDIAGCRLIFQNTRRLLEFRKHFLQARFDHKRKFSEDDRYNYIEDPKSSGYRGIHDVYEYVGSRGGKSWDGLLVEIQYRTKFQHAWATAVEVVGNISENQPKFNRGAEDHIEFFRIASEIIARAFEKSTSVYRDISNKELLEMYQNIEDNTHIFRNLQNIPRAAEFLPNAKNHILIFFFEDSNSGFENKVRAIGAKTSKQAVEKYFELEKKYGSSADIVLVRADSGEAVKNAYRNYFSDVGEFVRCMQRGIGILSKQKGQQ